ncbi:Hypothetical predicted protein [Lecanosticta acicola]|uniref:Uncharacterized protein n=1 Tax=Lecanosticta acicola TaxID=111012 RepID=A0AAI8YVJ0_9PEZI|nr:Hypothetical predicted protein [Lecanosticta acicola]
MLTSQDHFLDDEPPPYPPPAYSALADSRAVDTTSHRASDEHTFDAIQEKIASSKHGYEIWESNNGLTINQSGCNQAVFHVSSKIEMNVHELVMGRHQSRNIVARARLPTRQNGGFEIHIGSMQHPNDNDWISVRHTKDGGLLHKSDSYRFTVMGRPLVWKKTHSTALGSSKLASNDYKLLDETRVGEKAHPHVFHQATPKVIAGGDPIAVYLQHGVHGATGSRHMQIDWIDEFGDAVETAALITLMAILERTQNHIRQAGKLRDTSRDASRWCD